MSGQDMDLRDRAWARIAALKDDPKALIFDSDLIELLELWRFRDPVGCACGRCGQSLSWWALDPQVAVIRTAKRRKLKGKSNGVGGIYEFLDTAPDGPEGFGLSEREALVEQNARKQVELVDNPDGGVTGVVTRRKFRCGKCGMEYPLTNATMLHKYIEVVTSLTRTKITL